MHNAMDAIGRRMGEVLSTSILRLVVAAVLGGVIGLERQLKHRPAGLRTNMFICFGAAMFTVLSRQLAGTESDYTRIAAQIIPGIGFIGAGSILHSRGSVTGLTTAATLFVVAGVGMAAGGGLYIEAVFATAVLLIALALLGKLESYFALKPVAGTYEVLGGSAEALLDEVNRILEQEKLSMQNVHAAATGPAWRVVFTVDSEPHEHESLNIRLHESQAFTHVAYLGSPDHE
jgi:putative Mg2+ transporter-C (MgtC) family protein